MSDEIPLAGGNLSKVVQVGDTVRRPTGPWTDAVHSLLRFLEVEGLDGAPRVLGIDDQGREIMTYIPGETVGETQPWPDWVWSDAFLAKTARWLRRYHDTVKGFREPPGARWRMCWAPQRDDEIICHYDVAPYNMVNRSDGSVAVIDWDVAAPGLSILEVARTVNAFLPVYDVKTRTRLGFREGELNDTMLDRTAERINIFLDAYGLMDRVGFIGWMIRACDHSWQRISRGAREGDAAIAGLLASGIADHVQDTRLLLERHRDTLERSIE